MTRKQKIKSKGKLKTKQKPVVLGLEATNSIVRSLEKDAHATESKQVNKLSWDYFSFRITFPALREGEIEGKIYYFISTEQLVP